MTPAETLILCIVIALLFMIAVATIWYDARRHREDSKRLSAARQARIAELRAARLECERRHARRSDLDREIALLVARSLSHE